MKGECKAVLSCFFDVNHGGHKWYEGCLVPSGVFEALLSYISIIGTVLIGKYFSVIAMVPLLP
jgi:hypothetical protein